MVLDPKDQDKNVAIEFAKLVSIELGLHDPVTFPRFGTAMLDMDGEQVEFVMPRKEYYTEESRKPDTEIGTLEQDAKRRDFSINSLFLRLNDMQVLDLTGHGLEDLKNGIIRVTDPEAADTIFSQDPLRMLRAIRQSLQLGFEIDPETKEAIKRVAPRLEIISKERVRDELSKILVQDNPSKGVRFFQETGLLKYVLPELEPLIRTEQPRKWHSKDVWEHTLQVLDSIKPDVVARLIALLHDVGKPATQKIVEDTIHFFGHEDVSEGMAREILKRLKFPNDIIDQVTFAVGSHMRPHGYDSEWTDTAVRRFVREMGDHLEHVLAVAEADITSSRPERVEEGKKKVQELRQRIEDIEKAQPTEQIKDPLTGNDLMDLFDREPGPWIRDMKDYLMDKKLENPGLTKEEAIELAKAHYVELEKKADLLAVEIFQPKMLPVQEQPAPQQSPGAPIGTVVQLVETGETGMVVGQASRNETGTDIDWIIHWDKPLQDLYEISEVHPSEVQIMQNACSEPEVSAVLKNAIQKQAEVDKDDELWEQDPGRKLPKIEAAFKNLTIQTSDTPKELIDQIKEVQKSIDKSKLYTGEDEKGWIEGGLQKKFHITILYGVEEKDQDKIAAIVKEYVGKGLGAETGDIEYFDKKEDGYSVAVLRVDASKGLENLHKALKQAVSNKHSYDQYKAHITIAYLKPNERLTDVKINPVKWQINDIEETQKDGSITKVSKIIQYIEKKSWLKKKELTPRNAYAPDHPEKVKIKDAFGELTEQVIYNYWKSAEPKIFPVIQGKPIMLFIQVDGKIVRKRNTEDGSPIIVNTKDDYEKWVATGGTVSVHLVYPEKETTVVHVELDPQPEFPFEKTKKVASDLYALLDDTNFVKDLALRYSGNRGFYITMTLDKPLEINTARNMLKEILDDYIKTSGDMTLTTSTTKAPNSMRLDVSTNMPKGTLRAPYSLHELTGLVAIPLDIKQLKTFEKEQAGIDKIKDQISPVVLPEKQFKNDEQKTAEFWSMNYRIKSATLEDIDSGYTGKFVVQEHQAEKAGLHYDFRLEVPGELLERYEQKRKFDQTPEQRPEAKETYLESWAIRYLPQLITGDKDKVLAVQVEPHPIEYATFEGGIPEGYGAGQVSIFDTGTWKLVSRMPGRIKFSLDGKELKGNFILIQTKGNQWLLRKTD